MAVDLVTGASGFVGSHLVDLLLAQGRKPRLLLRPTSSVQWIQEDRVEIIRQHDWTPDTLAPVVEGVDRVYHLAGVTHAHRKTEFFHFHVNITRNLLDACCSASRPPRRVVIFSSLAAAGPSRTGKPLVEDDPPHPVSWYGQSKLEQERVAESYRDQLHIVVVRPPALYGPRDRDFLSLFRGAARGFYPSPAAGSGLQSLTYVDDIVHGAYLAGTKDIPSWRVYFVASHEIATWNAVGRSLEAAFGRHIRRVPIPLWVIPVAGAAGEAANRFLGTRFPRDRHKDMEGRFPHWTCSPARATRELGFETSCDLTEGIRRTARWYEDVGWL